MRNKISLFVAAFSVVTAEFALAAEMPYMNLLKPDMIFVDGAANSAGRIKVKLSSCRCMLREIFVYLSGEGPVSKVELVWNIAFPKDSVVYGGDWERTYGDSGWFRIGDSSAPHEGWKPWYFLVNDGTRTDGYGLMVQPNAFAAWTSEKGIQRSLRRRSSSTAFVSSVSLSVSEPEARLRGLA